MKKLLLIFTFLFCIGGYAQVNPRNHYVSGYHRKDGTYVSGHYRTNPNHTNRDNYSTRPNTNPWTGEAGYIEPDNNYLPAYNYSNSYHSNPVSYGYTTPKSTPTHNDYSKIDHSSSYSKTTYYNLITNYSYPSSAITYHDKYSLDEKMALELFLEGANFAPGIADGIFTDQTIRAIKELQNIIGVYADGKFGPITLKRLQNIIETP